MNPRLHPERRSRIPSGCRLAVGLMSMAAAGIAMAEQAPPDEALREARAAEARGDFSTAAALWAPLAEAGFAEAQFGLGNILRGGRDGVAPDPRRAYGWLRRAAEQGHPRAQLDLGLMLAQGIGVAANPESANYWYLEAAKQNVAQAQHLMCLSFALGKGVPADPVKAYAWCDLAAGNGLRDALVTRVLLEQSMTRAQITLALDVAGILRRGHVHSADSP
jgi:TPR repeat protein